VIERAVVLSSGPVLELEPRWLDSSAAASPTVEVETPRAAASQPDRNQPASVAPLSSSLEEQQRRHILAILDRTSWGIEGERGAARLLGLKPSTVRSRMKKLGIGRSSS